MYGLLRSITVVTALSVIPAGVVLAQSTLPSTSTGSSNSTSTSATPNYSPSTTAQTDQQPGATGKTVVPGDKSTVAGASGGTVQNKTGSVGTSEGGSK